MLIEVWGSSDTQNIHAFYLYQFNSKEKSISKYEILVNDMHAEDFWEVSDGFNFEMHKQDGLVVEKSEGEMDRCISREVLIAESI